VGNIGHILPVWSILQRRVLYETCLAFLNAERYIANAFLGYQTSFRVGEYIA